ncbi:hypothetical protein P8452_72157 [Trifolium repens]|nr:hypothetical protein P8452_72157 [Trifolium repens]
MNQSFSLQEETNNNDSFSFENAEDDMQFEATLDDVLYEETDFQQFEIATVYHYGGCVALYLMASFHDDVKDSRLSLVPGLVQTLLKQAEKKQEEEARRGKSSRCRTHNRDPLLCQSPPPMIPTGPLSFSAATQLLFAAMIIHAHSLPPSSVSSLLLRPCFVMLVSARAIERLCGVALGANVVLNRIDLLSEHAGDAVMLGCLCKACKDYEVT